MKNKHFKKFFAIFFSCFFLITSLCTPTVAYAADLPPWFSSVDNVIIDLADDIQYLNTQTGVKIFEYFDYLYANNMTDGMQLFAFDLRVFGGGATGGVAGKTTLILYFNTPDRPAHYAYRSASNLVVLNSLTGQEYNGYSSAYPLLFGNFKIMTQSNTGTINNFFVNNYYWGYRDGSSTAAPGVMTFGGSYVSSNSTAGNTDILPWLIDSRAVIETWISSGSGSGGSGGSGEPVVLDFAGLFSAVVSAPMVIFNGLTGSPGDLSNSLILFGIDIRATLISLLVIAIVYFIIRFLRGG